MSNKDSKSPKEIHNISRSPSSLHSSPHSASSATGTSKNDCSINIEMNGLNISLNPYLSPPKAEDLFHAMFFSEELAKAPSHYRQQRWNKRRIQKRWNWKRGREREIYEKRAQFLKNKWIELKQDFKQNNNTKLSKEFIEKNSNIKINDFVENINDKNVTSMSPNKENVEPISNADNNTDNDLNSSNISISSNKSNSAKVNKRNNNNSLNNNNHKLSKLEGKRKHIRRREKLIERIANGETLENFVDHQKLNNIYNNHNDNDKDSLLFKGINKNVNHKKSKSKRSKKRNKNQNNVVPMKLADFVEAAKQLSNPKKSTTKNHQNKDHKKRQKNDLNESHNKVSLAAIQAEQTKDLIEVTRRRRHEIHGTMSIAHKSKKASSETNNNNDDHIGTPPSHKQHPQDIISISPSPNLHPHPLPHQHGQNEKEKVAEYSQSDNSNNESLNHLMQIRNYDHLEYRGKIVNEIYHGSSVFDCIPCCIQPSNTLLIDALFMETLLNPNSSLANLSGSFELKKRLKKQFRNKTIEILPIFERAYTNKNCSQLILIQFQDIMDDAGDDEQAYLMNNSQNGDNTNCALTLYHVWKQQIQQINSGIHNGNLLRIEFIEKWFANAYFLQHSHLWSDIALTSNITIYDNNNRYIPNINNKARHCRCSYKRIIYFPPFNPTYSKQSTAGDLKHGTQCIDNCCCCTYYQHDDRTNYDGIHDGDVVLWHGRKCVAESKVEGSDQDYRIQIDGVNGKYVVALSSLQIVRKYKNLQNNEIVKVEDLKNLNSQIFDSQKHIWDDMSFVLYIKKFWNICTVLPQ